MSIPNAIEDARMSDLVTRIRCRVWERQLPKVIAIKDFDARGVRFEAAGRSELRRIVNRGHEREYLARMLARLEPGDVLYDIGANIGLVGLQAPCRTIAFEPDPGFYGRLRRNMDLNPSNRVEAHQMAICDADGTVTLFTSGSEGSSPSLVHQRAETGSIEVRARSLDSLIATGEMPAPTVVKFDIEGAEILALNGARRLLHGPNPPRLLLLEIHTSLLAGFGSSADEVLALVRGAGYNDTLYEATRADQSHVIFGR